VQPEWQKVLDEPEPMFPEAKKKPPACKEVPFSGTFAGDAKWKNVRTVRAGYGINMATRLVVELPRGWVMTPIAWDDDGANPLGCFGSFKEADVPEVRVENGFLVAVVDGERHSLVGEEWRKLYQRGVTWCKDAGGEITCEEHSPQFQEPLGWKIQPTEKGDTPWSKIPWKDLHGFNVGEGGKLAITEPKLAPAATADAGR
jgi:hypothetical protein